MAKRKSFDMIAQEVYNELYENIIISGYEAEFKLVEYQTDSLRLRVASLEKQTNRLSRALLKSNYISYDFEVCEVCEKHQTTGAQAHHPGCAIVEARRILGYKK